MAKKHETIEKEIFELTKYLLGDTEEKKVIEVYAETILNYAKQYHKKQVKKRYDSEKYKPPFRVGKKQEKAVLDGKGKEVIFFSESKKQAKLYCDFLNGYQDDL